MRGRIAGVGLSALVIAVMLAALGAPAASAACPNEAFRTGPSALLPECRAYEMVTSVEKESAVAVNEAGSPSLVTASGDGIYFLSASAYAGAQGAVVGNSYIAGRSSDDWGVQPIGGPQAAQAAVTVPIVSGLTDDLRLALVESKEALAPGAVPGGSNLYVRDNRTGSYTLVVGQPGNEAFFDWTGGYNYPFVGASTDWSDILIASRRALTPGAVDGQQNLFEFREGALHLAVAEAERADRSVAAPNVRPNVMSSDGSRFYYNLGSADLLGPLYLHLRGKETPVLVSEDAEGNPFPARFVGATPDGGTAFLYSPEGSLYRFEASAPAGERLTDLTPTAPGGESPGLLGAYAGEDGTTVYFAARGLLTPDAEPREGFLGADFYAWHGEPAGAGDLRYIGKSDVAEGFAPQGASVSPNGRFFGFESIGRVTPDATEGPAGRCSGVNNEPEVPCLNVFLYSLDTGTLVCASCSASPPTSNSRLGGAAVRGAAGPIPNPVLEDGSVFFESSNALVARDSNGRTDVYERRGDTTQLISTGTDPAPSRFIGVSASGSDVFIGTAQPLVGQDIDRLTDLYDARIGGGLPQDAPATTASCVVGGDCRSQVAPGQSPARPGTATAGGAGEGAGTCGSAVSRARAARKRSRLLARRAKAAAGGRAKGLRRKATREAKKAVRLRRRSKHCVGGGR